MKEGYGHNRKNILQEVFILVFKSKFRERRQHFENNVDENITNGNKVDLKKTKLGEKKKRK